LLDQNNKAVEIEAFVNDMIEPAEQGAKESEKMAKGFRKVQHELLMITTSIPGEVAKIEEQRKEERREKRLEEKRVERVKIVKACSTALAAVAGGIALIACPPALIILPIALPLISLVAEAYETRVVKRIAERERQQQSCIEALETLHKVSKDLALLGDCIAEFAMFWTNIDLLLQGVKGRVDELRVTKALRLRLKSVKSSWEEIEGTYRVYAVKIEHLCELAVISPPKQIESDRHSEKFKIKGDMSGKPARLSKPVRSKGFLMI